MGTENRPLRILHIVRPAEGGIRRHVSLLCAGLERMSVTCAVAAAPGFTLEGDTALPVWPISITAKPRPAADLRAALQVRRLASACDIIHAHGLRAAWVAALACDSRHPFLFTAHNLTSPSPSCVARLLFGQAARRARVVIAVSHAVAISLAPFGVGARRARVIPNGIDLDRWLALPPQSEARQALGVPEYYELVLAVGRLSPEKGFETLIAAATAIEKARPAARIWIAGDGPSQAAIEKAARESHAPIRMLGRREDVPLLMAASDVVAVPSLREGQGLTAIEAMAAARPVVASDVGGLTETVLDGVTGYLRQPGDPDGLARAIIDLLANEPRRNSMGTAGRQRAIEHYDVTTMVERTLDTYRAIVGEAAVRTSG